VVSRIQAITKNLCSEKIGDGTQLKETKSHKYEDHKCFRIFKGSKYIYADGKTGVDILNAKDLSHIATLDTDGKDLIFAIEVNNEYIFIECGDKSIFCFDLKKD